MAAGDVGDAAVVAIGRIGRPRGVRGDVFVSPWTDDPDERFAPGTVLRTEPAERGPLTIASSSTVGSRLVVHLVGVDDRDAAAALGGTHLVIAAADRPALEDPDEFYDTDLIGLRARSTAGGDLGTVGDVLHAGGADYLVLDIAGRERLVPFVAAIVVRVDVARGEVVIDPPEGLFDL